VGDLDEIRDKDYGDLKRAKAKKQHSADAERQVAKGQSQSLTSKKATHLSHAKVSLIISQSRSNCARA